MESQDREETGLRRLEGITGIGLSRVLGTAWARPPPLGQTSVLGSRDILPGADRAGRSAAFIKIFFYVLSFSFFFFTAEQLAGFALGEPVPQN